MILVAVENYFQAQEGDDGPKTTTIARLGHEGTDQDSIIKERVQKKIQNGFPSCRQLEKVRH